MIKQIKILKNSAVWDDKTEYNVSDNNEFKIKLSTSTRGMTPFLVYKYKNKQIVLELKDEISICHEHLSNGYFESIIELRKNGEIIEKYNVEPLRIVRTSNGYEGIKEVEELKNEVEKLKVIVAKMYNYIKSKGDLLV